jgi:hypothetical protein
MYLIKTNLDDWLLGFSLFLLIFIYLYYINNKGISNI